MIDDYTDYTVGNSEQLLPLFSWKETWNLLLRLTPVWCRAWPTARRKIKTIKQNFWVDVFQFPSFLNVMGALCLHSLWVSGQLLWLVGSACPWNINHSCLSLNDSDVSEISSSIQRCLQSDSWLAWTGLFESYFKRIRKGDLCWHHLPIFRVDGDSIFIFIYLFSFLFESSKFGCYSFPWKAFDFLVSGSLHVRN